MHKKSNSTFPAAYLKRMQTQHLNNQLTGIQAAQGVSDIGIGSQIGDSDDAILRHWEMVLTKCLQHVDNKLTWGKVMKNIEK